MQLALSVDSSQGLYRAVLSIAGLSAPQLLLFDRDSPETVTGKARH